MDDEAFSAARSDLLARVEELEADVAAWGKGPHGRAVERRLLLAMRATARGAHGLLGAFRAEARRRSHRCGAERARGGPCRAPAPGGGRCRLHGGPREGDAPPSPDEALAERAQRLVSTAMSAQATPRRRTSAYSPDLAAEGSRFNELARKRLAELRARAGAR